MPFTDPKELPKDSSGFPCHLENHYHCDGCDESWTDQWSCACDDECPSCGTPISPEDSISLVSPEDEEKLMDEQWKDKG